MNGLIRLFVLEIEKLCQKHRKRYKRFIGLRFIVFNKL